jgi:DNA-binding YbaB/EbfC family protein
MKARLPQGYGGGRADLMKRIQKTQEEMAALQDDLAGRSYTAKSGGSMVEATVKGDHTLVEVKISPEVADPGDVEMLGDLVVAAVNEAQRLAAEDADAETSKVTGGIDLAGMGF